MDVRKVAHLLEFPLVTGRRVLLDPADVAEVSPHRTDAEVTCVRCRDQRFTFYVAATYDEVSGWLQPKDG